jgi:pantoate--beta-alanine ligase
VIGGPTVRGEGGLALSSRNAKLSEGQYQRALWIPRAVEAAKAAYADGDRNAQAILAKIQQDTPPEGLDIDYFEFRDPRDLELVSELEDDSRLFIGLWLDGVRLIDNASVTDG